MAAAVSVVDADMVKAIRKAVADCSDRGLVFATKWAAELLAATPGIDEGSSDLDKSLFTSTPARPQTKSMPDTPGLSPATSAMPPPPVPMRHPHAPLASDMIDDLHVQTADLALEDEEEDILATGKACFDTREFLRAAHLLKSSSSARGQFLRIYSQYLAGEKRALQDWNKLEGDRHQPPVPVNPQLLDLLTQVQPLAEKNEPWGLFLRGLFLSRLNRREEAIEACLLSLQRYIWNWSAWTLLSSLIKDGEELSNLLPLMPIPPTHPLVHFFQIHTLNALHQPSENELGLCDRLLGSDYFPNSMWIMSLRACVLYHLHDFKQAEEQFEKILSIDPYRIDDIDVYSNILYVTEARLKLSKLAHDFLSLDKDRPEVCCLVGNHYSLRADHEKAIKYFRRATQLDQTYLSAWTLMGHEYVEMKNSHAAIEAYRRAVDVNRKDYRAWYGLGQAYELLNMHQYALHYFQRATALRPYDVRLWQAQGASYEEMGRWREAVECYRRALLGADVNEGTINLKLAKLHDDLEEYPEAAAYHQRVIDSSKALLKPVTEYAKSLMYVARFHVEKVEKGDLDLARDYLSKVAASNAEDAVQAAELLKSVNVAIALKEREERAKAEEQAVAEQMDATEDPTA
ncbi:TPR-like protein [Dentipellis sp. KUC8613]|nr:TPR-like protein [Dentipellis sp. KUC8613]